MRLEMLVVTAIAVMTSTACGGRAIGTTGAGPSSSGAGSSAGGDGNPNGAGGGAGTPLSCVATSGGGSSGGASGECQESAAGTCSDGTSFDINCSCPAGACTCSKQTSSSGTQTSQVSIACPQACNATDSNALVEACDFSKGGTVAPPLDAGLPACSIPAAMEPPQEPYSWSIGRALLDCQGGGLGTVCLSNDGTTCPGDPVTVGNACKSECAPNQYVVAYGGPPAPPSSDAGYLTPPLLASCDPPTFGDPAGVIYVCCPCQ